MSHLTLLCLLIAFLYSLQGMEEQERDELTYRLNQILEAQCTGTGQSVGFQVLIVQWH